MAVLEQVSEGVWATAKKYNEIAAVAPCLENQVELAKRRADAVGCMEHPRAALTLDFMGKYPVGGTSYVVHESRSRPRIVPIRPAHKWITSLPTANSRGLSHRVRPLRARTRCNAPYRWFHDEPVSSAGSDHAYGPAIGDLVLALSEHESVGGRPEVLHPGIPSCLIRQTPIRLRRLFAVLCRSGRPLHQIAGRPHHQRK